MNINVDESSLNHQNGAEMGPPGLNMGISKPSDDQSTKPQYSIPGVLHFIQHEWARFELERSQWEVDRAELQARIAFLQGERKGQENLKSDLVRRIKMLEFALKQERAKYHKLKYGVDLPIDSRPPQMSDETSEAQLDLDQSYAVVCNSTWKQSRQLLRQYLQEIGYTDRIIDVRSSQVRTMLGLNNNCEPEESLNGTVNEVEPNKRTNEVQERLTPAKKNLPISFAEAMLLDTEAAVVANLDFLSNTDVDMEDDDDMSDEADVDANEIMEADLKKRMKEKIAEKSRKIVDDVDKEAMEVLNELNLISETQDRADYKNDKTFWNSGNPQRAMVIDDDDHIDSALGLGELAQLTVNNVVDDSAGLNEDFRKTWNAKYTLRSHFDCVRALSFHPNEPVLITASEDHTMKLWNLQKTIPAKKSPSLDVEPLYTFRSHTAPVLSLAMSASGEYCYSGDLSGTINCWKVPNCNVDPYDQFEPDVLNTTLNEHTDAVWCLSVLHVKQYLLSCSSDGTVKLWSPHSKTQSLHTYTIEETRIPSSVDFVQSEPNCIVTAYGNSGCVLFDTETAKPILRLDNNLDNTNLSNKQINKIVCHPILPLAITAHEDHHIRFWDIHTGKIIHSMVAHLDAVTSLAVDPNGLYLLSGSHDCSIRLWHLDNKTCVQEITAHRKKFDESILDVAFHPTRPYIASAGADGLAKVFV